jgi:hypothetical protein
MARVFNNVFPLVLLAVVVYVFRAPLAVSYHQALRYVAPCEVPISYRITSIDPRFHVATSTVEKSARDAVAVWDAAAGKQLFKEVQGSPQVNVRLVYDVRQQTTTQLQGLGDKIETGTAQYDTLQKQYDTLRDQYFMQKAAFESDSASFERDAEAYQQSVSSWNSRGGAPRSVVQDLNSQKSALETRQKTLQSEQTRVNALADQVNALAARLNGVASEINTTAKTYNTVGSQTGEEFEEGVYESAAGQESITVYEFDSQDRLTRLLAHEFGHALGLEHVENSDSIMYRLNQSSNFDPTKEDVVELDRVCRIN